MLFPLLALMLVRIVTAQDPADPPTPNQLVRKLLHSSAEMISAASPQVQASVLLDLGRVTAGLDPKQSVVYLEQAFALTATLPESKEASVRSHHQALIVAAMAAVNPVKATQTIRRMEPAGDHTSRSEAVHKVVITPGEAGRLVGVSCIALWGVFSSATAGARCASCHTVEMSSIQPSHPAPVESCYDFNRPMLRKRMSRFVLAVTADSVALAVIAAQSGAECQS